MPLQCRRPVTSWATWRLANPTKISFFLSLKQFCIYTTPGVSHIVFFLPSTKRYCKILEQVQRSMHHKTSCGTGTCGRQELHHLGLKGSLWRDLATLYLMEWCGEDGVRIVLRVPQSKKKKQKTCWNTEKCNKRKTNFAMVVIKQQNRLPREVEASPSHQLDKVLSNPRYWTSLISGGPFQAK